MPSKIMDGYPQQEGAKNAGVIIVNGPTSYATGGFTVEALAHGFKHFDHVSDGTSNDGTHKANTRHNNDTELASGLPEGRPQTSVLVLVSTLAGVEIAATTDLSAEVFRPRAIGL